MDYSDLWGWNFSSGEADVAFSDAQNVDYGFGLLGIPDESYYTPITGFDGALQGGLRNYGEGGYTFGATPEVTTNDFGVTWDPTFGLDLAQIGTDSVKVAQQVANVVRATQSPPSASGGASGAKATTSSTMADIVSTFGTFLRQVNTVTQQTKTGTAAQRTTARPVGYTGQLTPSGGLLQGGMTANTLLMIGGAAVALALVLHFKKG